MQEIAPELIEKYQILLQKDPKSQVFAPLAEAYRKMGMLEEAFKIAVRGVQFNSHFAGGRIALAKICLDRENIPGAIEELEKSIELSPDNIMAHSLLAEAYLSTKRPKDALREFKMVLFLAPTNEKAIKAVKKLESLTADEYEDDLFEMKKLPDLDRVELEQPTPLKPIGVSIASELDRALSLIDAYIVRNDIDSALTRLTLAERELGNHPELIKRRKLISQRAPPMAERPKGGLLSRETESRDRKVAFLRELLERIQNKSQFT